MALALLLALLAARAHAQEGPTTVAPQRPSVAAIALSIRSRAIQDSRCYLMNGGAVESFFVSEDTPVGSVIGTLSVNGDPSDDGNISLTLQEKNAAVGIAPGTKNITLLRALDREEKRGPSNVYVNVRCDRRRTTDPSFIIPVSLRVWDVNDNAPLWVGAPYRVRVSELTAVGTRILHHVRATDADQPGPHATIHYSVLPGAHSEYFGFANDLDSILVVKKPLDYETLSNFTVTLRAQDQGTPALHNDTTLRVDVLDADDQNPRFSHDHYTVTIPDNAEEGTILETSPGPIVAQDQDIGINAPLYYSISGEKRDLVHVDRDTGRVAVSRRLLEAVDLPVTVVIKATQVDNPDRYALATLRVGRRGRSAALARGVRFTRRQYAAAVREDAAPGAVIAVLHTEPTRAETSDASPLQFYVSDRSFLEKFAINSVGEVLLRKPLDYETTDAYSYQVMVTDGVTNDTAGLNITVLNVNEWEPRFKHPQYEFRVDEESVLGAEAGTSGLVPVGTLHVHDGDAPDSVTLTLRGAHANMFYINASGEMFLRADALPALNTTVLHVVATAIDSGAPPRQTSVPVLVHVGPKLTARAWAARGGVVLLFACALALALLALLVCALLAYIYRNKRRSKVSSPSPPSTTKTTGLASHDKPRSPPLPTNGGTLPNTGSSLPNVGGTLASSGSLLSVSAGASTILANSSSSLDLRGDTLPSNNNGNGTRSATTTRQSTRFPTKTKIAPLPPTLGLPMNVDPPPGVTNVALMSDHLRQHSTGRSGVAWPSHTIPARVKKLSWDDGENEGANGDGQRGRRAGRNQPHRARPHEPHRLLLTAQPYPPQTHIYHPHYQHHPQLQHPQLHLQYPILQPQSVFDPSHLRIVHPHSKPNKFKNTKTKDKKLPPHSYLTNPHHPLVLHPQAINHTLLHNLNNATLPSNHPEAINHVLVHPKQHASSNIQNQVNRSYALPNTDNSVATQSFTNEPPKASKNKDPNHRQNHYVQHVSFSSPNPQNIHQPQPSTSHLIPTVQNTHHQRIQCETSDHVPNSSQPKLPFSFHPSILKPHAQSNQKTVDHSCPELCKIPRPSAPRLSQVDPLAALLRKGKGPPPDYATIDPRKLRVRSWRPSFLRRSELESLQRTCSTRDYTKNKTRPSNTPKGRR